MGAFNAELYALGYRFPSYTEESPIPQSVKDRDTAIAAMHLAKMPCPGSCGERCPNHHCPAHNSQSYKMPFTK